MTDLFPTPASRIIPALDMKLSDVAPFIDAVLPLGVTTFKVGLRRIHELGTPKAVADVYSRGARVFLDAKLHDTDDTMRDAAAAIAAHEGVDFFNLHASAGVDAMRRAVEGRGNARVLAVSVLTSLSPEQVEHIYGTPNVKAKVLAFARDAVEAGVHGLICSPLELDLFQKYTDIAGLLRFPPGIRPSGAKAGQQKRYTTPGEAIRLGATALVIGSPLYNPPPEIGSPVEAVKRVIHEIEQALAA